MTGRRHFEEAEATLETVGMAYLSRLRPIPPEDWIERLDKLPCQTLVHVPVHFRARLAGIMTACLANLARGDEHASMLERGRSKLLYGVPPKGYSLRTELGKRLTLWNEGRFEELLLRAEAQHGARLEARRNRRTGATARAAALRAKKLAAEGAYGKAVQGLTSETDQFITNEQETWTRKLLPQSGRAAGSPAGSAPASSQAPGGSDADAEAAPAGVHAAGKVLDGVRFAALSGPGLSGMRPEHLKDALSARARGVASRLRNAVAEFYSVAANGELADCVRWLLDSRLVFLKKKSGLAPRPVRIGECWRRVIGKKLVHETRSEAQALFLGLRQFGIAIPGGTDVLVHFRGVLE